MEVSGFYKEIHLFLLLVKGAEGDGDDVEEW